MTMVETTMPEVSEGGDEVNEEMAKRIKRSASTPSALIEVCLTNSYF